MWKTLIASWAAGSDSARRNTLKPLLADPALQLKIETALPAKAAAAWRELIAALKEWH